MMYEVTFSPMYAVLFSAYLNEISSTNIEKLTSDIALSDVNDSSIYASRVPQEDIERLIQRIYQVKGDLAFGLDIGAGMHPSDYGTVGYALMNCSSLFQVFEFAAKYKNSINKGFKIIFSKQGLFYHFRIDSLVVSEWLKVVIELDFSSALHLSKFFVGSDSAKLVKPESIRFQHAAQGPLSKYEGLFACPVLFNQKYNEIIFSRQTFEIPIRSANPSLFKLMESKLTIGKKTAEQQLSLKQKIERFMFEHIQGIEGRVPEISQAALEFNMSVSTVKKHLKDEKTHYTNIADQVRHKLALNLLMDPRKSILDISNDLGFSNASTFNRAFKRWCGQSPTAYRKQNVATRNVV